MLDIEVIRRQLAESVPFSRVLGVQVVSAGVGHAETLLPESGERLNHVGTVHAVAQFGLGETTAGVLLVGTFNDLQARGIVPVAAEVAIHYLKPARGDLHGRATLSSEEQARIREEVERTGRSRVTVPVVLADDGGTLTTEFEIGWVLLKPRE
jgi:acyl-coenzyme A thioesterase PaaI-like protein